MRIEVVTVPRPGAGAKVVSQECSGASPFHLSLQALPGASAIHVSCSHGEAPDCRFEIPVEGSETLEVEIAEQETVRVTCPGRTVLRLPRDPKFAPPPPIAPAAYPDRLDLALLIDGTMRFELSKLLLDQEDLWEELSTSIGLLISALASGVPDLRIALIAFGDQPVPRQDLPADDLEPRYHLYPARPEDRRFRSMSPEDLVEGLKALPSSSGGDFVDALADGLNAARELHWRNEARRVLLVVGDSPGPSLERPELDKGDIRVRDRDVDIEAMGLHKKAIEIATLYVDPSWEKLGLEQFSANELLVATERQYLELASLPSMAFRASDFHPDRAGRSLLERPDLIARGPAPGRLMETELGTGVLEAIEAEKSSPESLPSWLNDDGGR